MNPQLRSEPIPFTSDDYAARMARVVDDAIEAGLDGVIVRSWRRGGRAALVIRGYGAPRG